MTKKGKGPGVPLNSEIVRSIAKSKGIHSPTELNYAILKAKGHTLEGPATKAGERAWRGVPINRRNAEALAKALGLESYHELQKTSDSTSFWSKLRMDESKERDLFELQLKPKLQRRGLFTYEDDSSDDEPKISINARWRLELVYEPGYYILALLRNKDEHTVIVPSNKPFPTRFEKETVYIPSAESWLSFNTSKGAGWREIIVIACRDNIFPIKNEQDDDRLAPEEREKIAAQLLSDKLRDHYAIQSIVFVLTDN
jgi:hypothetical protein